MRLLLYYSGKRTWIRRYPLTHQMWISRQWLSTVTGGEEGGGKDEVVLSPRLPPLTSRVVGVTPFDTHTVYKQFQEAGKILGIVNCTRLLVAQDSVHNKLKE